MPETLLAEMEIAAAPLSLTGFEWRMRPVDERLAVAFQQKFGLPEIVARILAARGVLLEDAENFLSPSLKASLPDPSHLLDMDKAAERVARAVMAGERIAIFGDYDVDGATSSALLARYFRALGLEPIVYIPDRMKEGYGPNAPALLKLKEQGATVVITVDCGTLAHEPLEVARNAGLDVIVIDHHQGEAKRPAAHAIVNPNRLDESSPHRQLAAVGVAFLLLVSVNRVLRKQGWFSNSSPYRGEVGRGAIEAHRYPLAAILNNARELQKTMTDAERLLWSILRREHLGVKFRKQHPVGKYITDFACLEQKLIIELDGGQHNEEAAIKKDEVRSQFLKEQAFSVLRFWNNEVLQNTDSVLESIYLAVHGGALQSPLPNPPPTGEGIKEPDLKQFLDLVALGTICDVVPLTGLNRALVSQGLKIMAGRGNAGICAVLDLASVSQKPGVFHAGFVVGPRINAGGRVGKSDLGVRLLISDDEAEALALAKELDLHNSERKAIEAAVLEEAMQNAMLADAQPILIVTGCGWHPGVIGIVAGRLKERFHKPAIAIAVQDGVGKASARSVSGFDMGAAVISAREAGLLVAGGGHAMAAGFTVEENKIPALIEFLQSRAREKSKEFVRPKSLWLDGRLSLGGVVPHLAESLEQLGPFGQGNPGIRLAVHNVINLKPAIVGENHVRTLLIDRLSQAKQSAIAFRCVGTKLGDALLATRGQAIDIACQIRMNEWMGKRSIDMVIEDIASSQS